MSAVNGNERSEVARSLDLSIIRYSRVWEDHRVLSEALQLNETDDVISITSSGDNVLCLLLEKPKSIVAIDMSPAQNSLLELKVAAIRELNYKEFLCLLGEIPGQPNERVVLYHKISHLLSSSTKDYFDNNIDLIEQQLCLCGRLDKYFWSFYTNYISKIIPDNMMDALFDCNTLEEQQAAFHKLPLAEFAKALNQFSSAESQKSGRSSSQLKYATKKEDEVANHFWTRLSYVCQNVPIKDNFYLSLFLRGHRGYNPLEKPHFCTAYLREDAFHQLKGLVDRIVIHTGSVETYFSQTDMTFSKANLSDIFEYASEGASDELFSMLADKCRDGGRLAFWNMLVPRIPADKRLHTIPESEQLHAKDRLMYYQAFYCSSKN